jgi:hypothetical protein
MWAKCNNKTSKRISSEKYFSVWCCRCGLIATIKLSNGFLQRNVSVFGVADVG